MRRTVTWLSGSLLMLTLAAGSVAACAACPTDADIQGLADDVLAAVPAPVPAVDSMADALCAQRKLVAILQDSWGAPSGYKVGLTSKAAQNAFDVDEPVRGVLFSDMMLQDGAVLTAEFGAVPRIEADLIVVVADAGINDATTPQEVLAHLKAVRPFIELPDLVVNNPKALNAAVITAINVGARKGVLGAPIAVEQSAGFLSALADMSVAVTNADGKVLTKAPGAAVLGQPLNSVLWLLDQGVTLKAGDLVSVGSFGPLLTPKPGMTVTVSYEGLADDPSISVSFE